MQSIPASPTHDYAEGVHGLAWPQHASVHGVPVVALLDRCHTLSHRYYRQQGMWEPYEEYVSAGYAAIADSIHRFQPTLAPPGGFLSFCCFRMEMEMRAVRLRASGSHNMRKWRKGERRDPKYTVEGFDHELLYAMRSHPARQDTICFLHETLDYLQAQQNKAADILLAIGEGESAETIADVWGLSVQAVRKHAKVLRRKLRAWANYLGDSEAFTGYAGG